MNLGNFSRHAGGALTQNLAGIPEAFFETMWRFIQHDGAIFEPQALERPLPFTGPRREKTHKQELFAR